MNNKNKIIARLAAGALATAALVFALAGCQPDQKKRAIVIGIDGVQWEKLQALPTPNFDRLQFTKAYSGGINNSQKQQVTSSGASWTTLLTGVWADKHKVVTNTQFGLQAKYLTFLGRARLDQGSLRTSAIINWGNPYTLYYPFEVPLMKHFRYYPNNDTRVTSEVVDVVSNDKADVIFVHLNDPDREGHAHGFGENYDASILTADQQIGQILDAVEQREASHPDEAWLVMTVTDHGREEDGGFNHGSQTQWEKTVYIGMNHVEANEEFTTPSERLPYDDFDGLYSYPGQTAVAVTVMRHLNIADKYFAELEGTPLVGELGVRKLFGLLNDTGDQVNLSWLNSQTASDTTTVTRNGMLIAEIDNTNANGVQTLVDDLSDVEDTQLDYVVTTNDIASYFRLQR